MNRADLHAHLDALVDKYNRPHFIEDDPIQIPHRFTNPQDIEVSGYLTATIAWGQRVTILKNASSLMEMMDNSPFDFLMNATESEIDRLQFIHRTFNSEDLGYLLRGLRNLYQNASSLSEYFLPKEDETDLFPAVQRFRDTLTSYAEPGRTAKHIANPEKGAAAKRIHMYLRWMVRRDNRGVDFGLWENIPMSHLSCPLDVHTGNNARALGLLKRVQNDRRAVEELDKSLRAMDSSDPVKYDFALFGLGVDPLLNLG